MSPYRVNPGCPGWGQREYRGGAKPEHRSHLTQKALADAIGIHVSQVQRYESGASQPTLYALRRIAVALGVSADLLLFDKDERGPDDDLRMEFEEVSQLAPEAKQMVREVLRSLLLSYQIRRVVSPAG